ncbi:hypothetical protein [Streptomyces azureus]|uniref:Uncharacterized protein n=1 Tax=Streptomyces azureus TaxID=146537 RepID=A0A0K8PVL8_STRAJ|nr:hypothetical protein [Streptomyces azureus]GAP51763.1 uncharacterized protein SAZU_6636 [Streptomyces azureus]
MTEEIREAVLAVREETLRAAKVSMRTKERMIHQYVRETFGTETSVPGHRTLCRVWREWFGPGGARQCYARSAELPMKNGHVVIHRPGQVVALDTTVLPVMVREGVFGDPVKPHLDNPPGYLYAFAGRVPASAPTTGSMPHEHHVT